MAYGSTITAIALFAATSIVHAENCEEYPPGPARFECASRTHPGLAAKRERCMESARQMGLKSMAGGGGGGNSLKGYVLECMRRK
jgi:hypothetical protein